MAVFSNDIRIRFADCDPGGIAYYPRLIEKLQQTVECWFEEEIGMTFREIHIEKDWGMPLVRLECDFMKPNRLSDVLTFKLWLEKLGRTSFIARQDITCDGELRATARMVMVMRSFNQPDSIVIPDALREVMAKFLIAPEEEEA